MRFFKENKRLFLAIGLLSGTAIGAGIFSLPYVFKELGLLTGFFYLFFFAGVYFLIHSMYAELVEASSGEHQFFYFARTYLKKPLAVIASFSIFGELLFVLTVYLVLVPTFSEMIFPGGAKIVTFIFWLLGSVFVFAKLDWLGFAEFLDEIIILGIAAIVFFIGSGRTLEVPLFNNLNWLSFFLPFGPLLFSLAARPAIPEVVEEHKRSKKEGRAFSLKKAIFIGTFLPAVIYLLFALSILRLNPNPSPEALNGLGFLSPGMLLLFGVMGLVTLLTSYFVVALNIKDILKIDLKQPGWFTLLIVFFGPVALFFLGFRDFLSVVSLTGGIFLALEGIFVILMWLKAFPNHKRRWIAPPLFLIFLTAIIYQIISF